MNRRIRVVQYMHCFQIGGIERMVEGLVPAFEERGVDTIVAASGGDGPVRQSLLSRGKKAVVVPRRDGVDPMLALRLARLVRSSGADLVHTHHLGPFIYGAAAARLAGVPHVHTEHSHETYDAPRRRALGRRMDGMASVVAVSEEISAWRGTVLGRSCPVIPNGVPVPAPATAEDRSAARAAMEVGDDEVALGCVARLSPEKDHATLLRAFHAALPTAPRLRLVLVGDGREGPALRSLAADLGVADRVRFLGSRSDVARLVPGLDLFALTSRHEGLPLALLEALAAGIPAITTRVGEMPRVLASGAGLTVPPGDVPALAAALARAALDPEWRASSGRAGRAQVVAAYSMDAMADAYLALYRDALHARKAA